jgi:HK97 gp10 family phage protein
MERNFDRVARRMERAFEIAVQETAENIRDEARASAPVQTGALKNSIEARMEGSTAEVSAGVDYAPFVEYGTSNMAARPFMFPASEIERTRFVTRVEQAGRRAT